MSGVARKERWGLSLDAMEEVNLTNPSIKLSSPPQQVEQMEKRAAEEKEKEIMERKV